MASDDKGNGKGKDAEVWSAALMHEAYQHWGPSLCDACHDMHATVWGVSYPGNSVTSVRCTECMAKLLATAIPEAFVSGLLPITESADIITLTRTERGDTRLEIVRYPDELKERLSIYDD